MSNQEVYEELRGGYARKLAKHDQAISRLVEKCVENSGFAAYVHNLADDFIKWPAMFTSFDPRQQALLAMLAHKATTELMITIMDQRIELEAGR
jgi:hypothetical protein